MLDCCCRSSVVRSQLLQLPIHDTASFFACQQCVRHAVLSFMKNERNFIQWASVLCLSLVLHALFSLSLDVICDRFSIDFFVVVAIFLNRSRSATPSSYPGTPPQHHPSEAIGASNYTANTANTGLSILPTGNQMKANEYAPRNYSDFIRNLAAKYNNNNPNE